MSSEGTFIKCTPSPLMASVWPQVVSIPPCGYGMLRLGKRTTYCCKYYLTDNPIVPGHASPSCKATRPLFAKSNCPASTSCW